MKFLVMGSIRDSAAILPPSVVRPLLEATNAAVNQQRKAGKLLETYWVPGWGRVVAISESKSAEEIVQNMNELPVSGFMNYEIYPLADYDESAKIMLERMKAMEKMMPAPPK